MREMLEKRKIEEAKKEHERLLKRGEEALKISQELEKSIASGGAMSPRDRNKLADLEKLVKKIRGDLGGEDGEAVEDVDEADERPPADVVEGVKALSSATLRLVDELKKTTRFSISAVAIRSSNSVLKIARFLRFGK